MAETGKWNLTIKTPMGEQKAQLELVQDGASLSGKMSGAMGAVPIENGKIEGETFKWSAKVTSPMPITLEFSGKREGADLNGSVKLGAFGSSTFTGKAA